ncbi:MAG: transcription antitermination factor NusB [Clostridia bacterium]|nr:transcription antitermination factor NusB [Clostridia bacterium]
MTRHESRETAFIICFEMLFQKEADVETIINAAGEGENYQISKFAKDLALTVYNNVEEIDLLIEENLVKWSIGRISKVSRAVLRLAVAEIKYTDIPVGAAVNEAVEICKKYSTPQDSSFINGVLASVAKQVRK